MMKRVGAMVMIVAGLMFWGGRPSQAADPKIGVVDFQRVLDQSSEIRKLNQELEQKIRAEEKVITERKESLEKKKENWEKQKSVLSQEVRTSKEEELRRELKDLQRYANDKQDEFQRQGADLMKKVIQELSEIVRAIGEKEGYTLVVEHSTAGVVYAAPATDLTERVSREYDKRHKK